MTFNTKLQNIFLLEENTWENFLLLHFTCLKNHKASHCVLIRKLRAGREKIFTEIIWEVRDQT